MTIDPEDLNEEANALHVEQVVSMDAGLFEVFDDDDVDEECVGDVPIDYDALSFDGGSFGEILETAESKAMSIADDEKPASVSVIKPKKKRQSLKIEHADRGLPPPRWHSEAADKFHRKAIQMEM